MSINFDKYVKRFGNSGLHVNPIVFGVMLLATEGLWFGTNGNKREGLELLKAAYDAGLRTFDTADVYSNGRSELLLGEFIKEYNIPRESIVILSKGYFAVHEEADEIIGTEKPSFELMNRKGLSRKHLLDAAEASVKRLGTYIDVYQIHRYDTNVSNEEIMKALNEIVDKGYARYIGASSMKTYEFIDLQYTAKINGWHQFISTQTCHNLLYREDERELYPWCAKEGIAHLCWSPNARGFLARPATHEKSQALIGTPFAKLYGISDESTDFEIVRRVEKVAAELGKSMAQVSVAWLVAKGEFPIVGIPTKQILDETIDTMLNVELTKAQIEYLEEPYRAKSVAPLLA